MKLNARTGPVFGGCRIRNNPICGKMILARERLLLLFSIAIDPSLFSSILSMTPPHRGSPLLAACNQTVSLATDPSLAIDPSLSFLAASLRRSLFVAVKGR